MFKTPEREKYIAFTHDYLSMPWVIITRDRWKSVSELGDLNHHTVAIERKFVIEHKLRDDFPRIRLVECTNSAEALNAVSAGKADAYVGNLNVANYLINHFGPSNLKISAPTRYGYHKQPMGIRLDWPELATIINKGLDAMADEQKAAIRSKWLSPKYEFGVRIRDVLSIAFIAGGFIVVILGTILYWNRRLKNEVSERVRARKVLHDTLDEQTVILDNALVGILFVKDRTVVRANRRFEEMFGFSPGEIVGQKTSALYLSEPDFKCIGDTAYPLLDKGKSFSFETMMRHKRGKPFWVRLYGEAVDSGDLARGSIWIVEDITEQKQYEEELRNTLAEQTTILDNALVGIVRIKKGKILWVNKKFAEIFGYAQDEMIGLPVSVIYTTEDDCESMAQHVNEEAANGVTHPVEKQLKRKDGSLF